MQSTIEPLPAGGAATEPALELNENFAPPRERWSVNESPAPTQDESGVEATLRRMEARLRDTCERWKDEIREYPARAVLLAAAGGFVCRQLPVRSLLMTSVRIFSAFTPPTLVALGICKAAEYWKRRRTEEIRRRVQAATAVSDAGIVMTDA